MTNRVPEPSPRFYDLMGRIAVHWNYVELSFKQLIAGYLGLEGHARWLILENMSNQSRGEILAAATNELEQSEEAKDHLLYVVKLFNRNRENRNQLMHSICDMSSGGHILIKTNRGLAGELRHIDINWDSLTNVLESIDETEYYITELHTSLRKINGLRDTMLPDKPPLPDKLTTRLLFSGDV